MKYTIGLIAAVAAIGSSAQSFADLPECGVCCICMSVICGMILLIECSPQKTCLQGVLDKAVSDLGCDPDDAGCLCSNVNFTYGIRDCSLSACKDQADGIINYGAEYCRSKSRPVYPCLPHCPSAHGFNRRGRSDHHHCQRWAQCRRLNSCESGFLALAIE